MSRSATMAAVILAAGKGTRMKSTMPKVLHQVAGRSMLQIVCTEAGRVVDGDICLVVGSGAQQVRAAMGEDYLYAVQEPQLGTGHAVMQALPAFSVLPEALMVLCGDTPLLTARTLSELRDFFFTTNADCTVMSTMLPDGGSYGRIVRDVFGTLLGIVEARDATPEQRLIREINSGVYCFRTASLQDALAKVRPNNAQGEYYLTDVLELIRSENGTVNAFVCDNAEEINGVNDRFQLAEAEAVLRDRIRKQLLLSGVTLRDPSSVYVDAGVEVAADTVLEPQVYLQGRTKIGAGCHIGPCVKIVDREIDAGSEIGPFVYLPAED